MGEIELFIKRWQTIAFLKTSYRKQIINKTLYTDGKKIIEHSREIIRKTKPLKNFEIAGLEDILTSIVNIADRMSELGWNAEQIFSLPLREIEQTEPARINKLVSEGDNICTDLQSIIPKLDKLRRDLS